MTSDKAIMTQIRNYEKWVIDFFGRKPFEAFEDVLCPLESERTTLPADSVRCFYRGAGLDIWRCKCGMVWNAHQPTQATLDEFYSQSKAMELWAGYKQTEHEIQRQRDKFSPSIDHILNREVQSVLDYGAGNGIFIKLLSQAAPDIQVFGVDPSPHAIEQAKNNGVDVRNVGLDELISKQCLFDVVTLWGVLEHIKDPVGTLIKLSKLTQRVLVCVPNVESTVVKSLGRGAFTFCPQHLWYFSLNTLDRLLMKAGFKIESSYTIEDEIGPIQKHRRLFDDPYRKDIPEWAWKDEKIIEPTQGYKLVTVSRKI